MNIGALKFGGSPHHERHADMLGANVVWCNQYKKGVNGYTRISKKYLIKYGCVGNQNTETDVLWQYSTSTFFVQGMFDLNWPPLNL